MSRRRYRKDQWLKDNFLGFTFSWVLIVFAFCWPMAVLSGVALFIVQGAWWALIIAVTLLAVTGRRSLRRRSRPLTASELDAFWKDQV